MKKMIGAFCVLILLCACGTPSYSVRGPKVSAVFNEQSPVIIVKNEKTKKKFLNLIQTWLQDQGYQTKVVADEEQTAGQPYLKYSAYWRWDLFMFLTKGSISAYQDGAPLSMVRVDVPHTFNIEKFSPAQKRVKQLMSLLFFGRPADGVELDIDEE